MLLKTSTSLRYATPVGKQHFMAQTASRTWHGDQAGELSW